MELWIGALNLGILYAFMTMGVFITFRIYDFPDITVDGSFTTGAAVTAVLLVAGINPFLSLLVAFLVGALAGCTTALIHTRLKINGLLAGILVMTGLYSINLHIMGRSNIPLLHQANFFSFITGIKPGFHDEIWTLLVLLLLIALFSIAVSVFFKTDLGISMWVTGNNPTMAAAAGINVDGMKIFGVGLANGLVAVSGGLVAQYQGFADIGMGIGTIVIGLAAVIIGESILRMRAMFAVVLSVIVGSVIFRFMIACALYVGLNPLDLKLLTAVFVLVTLILSKKVAVG
jgi:putative ABC transport system permease protein